MSRMSCLQTIQTKDETGQNIQDGSWSQFKEERRIILGQVCCTLLVAVLLNEPSPNIYCRPFFIGHIHCMFDKILTKLCQKHR